MNLIHQIIHINKSINTYLTVLKRQNNDILLKTLKEAQLNKKLYLILLTSKGDVLCGTVRD